MCCYLQRHEASLNPFTYSVVSFFYVIKSPTKKPLPEDFAPGGGPTILCIYLQRHESPLNPNISLLNLALNVKIFFDLGLIMCICQD